MRNRLHVIVAGACMAALIAAASTAEAGWRWGGSSGGGSSGGYGSSGGADLGSSGGGSSGGYGSWNTWGWGSSGGSWGGHGSSGGFLHRWKHRHHGSNGGGSSGGYGSSGGNGSSGGYHGGSSGGGVIYDNGAPVETQRVPMNMDAPPPPTGDTPPPPAAMMGGMNKATDALLSINVPDDAKIYVNGKLTKSTGGDRHFISRGLVPGNTYTYEVKAIVERDGREIEEIKTVKLRAGDVTEIAMEVAEIINPITTLKVTVPADAQVTLAGNETTTTGVVRSFTSQTLPEGKTWEDYTIKVTTIINGQPVTLEKTIDLHAGDNAHIEFDFDRNEAIADAR